MRLARAYASLLCAALALAPVCAHADPTVAEKETARALLLDGRARLAAKDFAGALKAFQGAHAIMGVPTTGLDLARGLEGLGRLIEARAAALDVTRIPVKPGESPAFAGARATAATLAEQLAARIPALVVTVKAPPGVAPAVTLDGSPLPAALLGLPRKVDPGPHIVEASAPGLVVDPRQVEVREGENLAVELTVRPKALAPPLAAPPPAPPPPGERPPAPVGAARVPVWAWVAGGAGIAALGGSVGFAVDYAKARSTLAADCPGNVCDPAKVGSGASAAERMQSLRGRWNHDVALLAGLGAAGVAGVTVAVLGIRRAPQAQRPVAIMPVLVPGAAALTFAGAF